MPFPAMQKLLDDAFPDRTYNYWKSTFLEGLSDEAIDVMVEHANRAHRRCRPWSSNIYGGAAGRVGDSETAFAQRQAEYDIGIMAQWTDPPRATGTWPGRAAWRMRCGPIPAAAIC